MLLKANDQDREYEPIPAGVHLAVCSGVVDLGLQWVEFNDEKKTQRKIGILFELLGEFTKNERGEEIPRVITREYTLSFHEKANLHKMLVAWRNKPFTETELTEGFELNSVIGVGCQLSISHTVSAKGRQYAAINAIMAVPKGITTPEPRQIIKFDLDAPDALEAIETLPDWMKEKIRESETFKGLTLAEYIDTGEDLPF